MNTKNMTPRDPQLVTYKTGPDYELKTHIFPTSGEATGPRPAMVMFHGGGWSGGTPTQVYPIARYFAARGILCSSSQYRLKQSHGVKPITCVEDARSSVRWHRDHAADLGIDPARIIVLGSSAGAHIGACTTMGHEPDDPREDTTISCAGCAMVLLNPVLATTPEDWQAYAHNQTVSNLIADFADWGPAGSPLHLVRPGLPPTIIFHGTEDVTVPFAQAEGFTHKMQQAGNDCTLVPFEGKGHAFWNFGKHNNEPFVEIIRQMEAFFARLGLIQGEPMIDEINVNALAD